MGRAGLVTKSAAAQTSLHTSSFLCKGTYTSLSHFQPSREEVQVPSWECFALLITYQQKVLLQSHSALVLSASSAWKKSTKRKLYTAIYSYFTFFSSKLLPVQLIMTVLFPSKAILIASEMHFPPQFSQLVMKLHFLGTFNHQALWRSARALLKGADKHTASDSDGLKLVDRFSPK